MSVKIKAKKITIHWSFKANPYVLDTKDWDWELMPEGLYLTMKDSDSVKFRPWHMINEIHFERTSTSLERAAEIARKTVI